LYGSLNGVPSTAREPSNLGSWWKAYSEAGSEKKNEKNESWIFTIWKLKPEQPQWL
jgi:hypothetical protein